MILIKSRISPRRVRSAADLSPVFPRFSVHTGLEPEQNIYPNRVQKYTIFFEYANFLEQNIKKPALMLGQQTK